MNGYFLWVQEYKRSHVPAFGSWDCNDDLPFTQCFESARQAGLLRYSYSEDRDLYVAGDLYQNDVMTPAMIVVPRRTVLFFDFPIQKFFFFLSRVFLSNQTCHFCCIHSNSYVEYDCFFWHFKPTKDVICIAHLFVLKFKLQHDGEYDCFSYKNSPFLVFLSYKHAFCVAYLFFFLHVWVQTPTCSRIWLFFQLQKNQFSFGFLANQTMNFAPFLFCFVLFFYVYDNNNVLKTPS